MNKESQMNLKKWTLFSLLFTALLAGCQTPDTRPAIQAAALAQAVFEHHTAGNEAVFRRGNPSAESLAAYMAAVEADRAAYRQVNATLLAAIGSIGTVSPEQIEAITAQVVSVIQAVKQ